MNSHPAEEPEHIDEEAAKGFVNGQVSLGRVNSLSQEGAIILAKASQPMFFTRLEFLSDEVANILAEHKNELWLPALKLLSKSAVKSLSFHRKTIALPDSLFESGEIYSALSTNKIITIFGLSDKSIRVDLTDFASFLSLDCIELSEPAAKYLTTNFHHLVFDNLYGLSKSAASVFENFGEQKWIDIIHFENPWHFTERRIQTVSEYSEEGALVWIWCVVGLILRGPARWNGRASGASPGVESRRSAKPAWGRVFSLPPHGQGSRWAIGSQGHCAGGR